jgi:adenylate cyclase
MINRIRLASGLVLFAFVLCHLANHAAGLVSLEALEQVKPWFLGFWISRPGVVLLSAAAALHVALACWALYRRRRLAMRPWEALQYLLGFAIPFLLLRHVLGTQVSFERFGMAVDYPFVLLVQWRLQPWNGIIQAIVLVVAWAHGCLGLHFWLRLKPSYERAVPALYAAALLVPVLSLLGFFTTGRQVLALSQDPAWIESTLRHVKFPGPQATDFVDQGAIVGWVVFGLLLLATLSARGARAVWRRRHGVVRLTYPGGREVDLPRGGSVLDASRAAGIPHASVCGGRGRCSTCRVRVGEGAEALAPPDLLERRVLDRVGAPPNVRLACQLRPTADLQVTPLLPPAATPREGFRRPAYREGEEREVAILFADLRGFTGLAEARLPYDVVFVLNRFFMVMGRAVETAGGRVDKFLGDGVMALFGIDAGPRAGSRQALAAARAMGEQLIELNRELANDLPRPLRIGIGIHVGPAIIGEMGYGGAVSLTAIGDSVNAASRLEALTKTFDAELVVSQDVADHADADLGRFAAHEIEVRGRSDPMRLRVVASARELPLVE